MKKFFFTGFITLLPLTLTFLITLWLFDLFTGPFLGITEPLVLRYEQQWGLTPEPHDALVLILSRILALIFLFTLILLTGFLARRFAAHLLVKWMDRLFSKIPLIRTIYRLSHDVTKAFFSENTKTFQRTVLTPFPHHQALAIGFVTGETPPIFKEKVLSDFVVFVPTAPHPISGFVLLAPQKLTIPTDISVEDAFKFIISCGVIHPGESPSSTPSK